MSIKLVRRSLLLAVRTISRRHILTTPSICGEHRFMTMASGLRLSVEHDKNENEFYIDLGEEKAYLQYTKMGPNLVDLEHTVVPEQHRGHGIAKVLAQSVFDHFVKEDINMKLTCTYLQKFYNDNPLPSYTNKIVDLDKINTKDKNKL